MSEREEVSDAELAAELRKLVRILEKRGRGWLTKNLRREAARLEARARLTTQDVPGDENGR